MNHIQKRHPEFSGSFNEIIVSEKKCPICGMLQGNSKNSLPICEHHYVPKPIGYIITQLYFPLKSENNALLCEDSILTYNLLIKQLQAIFEILTWEPENISEDQFLFFNEVSIFTGYLLLRIIESCPDIVNMFFSSDKIANPSKEMKRKMDLLNLKMEAEFELFFAIKMASGDLFDLALEEEKKALWIIPKDESSSIANLLNIRLINANEQWRGTFRSFLKPSHMKTAHDEFGTAYSFDKTGIQHDFDTFLRVFNSIFETNISLTYEDFINFDDWLKWVVSIKGITQFDYSNGLYFEDYKEFGIDKTLVFSVLDAILDDPYSKLDLISGKNLASFDPNMSTLFKLANLVRGFKISNEEMTRYFFPCREWFYNKIQPVFVKFAQEKKLAGDNFEQDITILSELYSTLGIQISDVSPLGIMFKPRVGKKPKDITSRGEPWRILAKTYEFILDKSELTEEIGVNGEIDLIVYANMSLYLIELKARNLDSRQTSNYFRNDAPVQCARYSAWARSEDFNSFLTSKGLNHSKIKSVRVVICSSGAFKEHIVTCNKTSEDFAIVPEFILFSMMAGIFSLSLKNPFPSRVDKSIRGIKICKDITKIYKINNDYNVGIKLSELLTELVEIIHYDRRKPYNKKDIERKIKYAPALNIFGTTNLCIEGYIGNTVNWILDEPYFITKKYGYSFYVGTQIATVGNTIVCQKCKSVIKYYLGEPESKNYEDVTTLLNKNICTICEHPISDTDETNELRLYMTEIIGELKRELYLLNE